MMSHEFEPYAGMIQRAKTIALAGSAASLLSWDQETFMPPRALAHRAEQLAFLSGWTHRMFVDPEVGDWIKACEDHGYEPGSDQWANLREWRRHYDRQTKVPQELVEAFEKAKTLAREAWIKARAQKDFGMFREHLEIMVDFSRRLADCWGYEDTPYDALLDEYEPGVKAAALSRLFENLRLELAEILGAALEKSASIPADLLRGHYPVAAQQAFNREVAAAFGFDFEAGRIDTTTHPFCTGLGPGDCRITTRYDEADFSQSLYGILHEVGHGLYDQGLPEESFGLPLGSAVSLGIHESQSRLWENHVGRTTAFWEHWHPVAVKHFPELGRHAPETILSAINRVSPSFIRVEADQVTYDLHIILRFEVEKKLIEGELKVADVPGYWNETFESMLGLAVPDDSRGCLQDIHWSLGSLGYFPTYTLGNLNAAQLYHRAGIDHAPMQEELAQGRYDGLLDWLRNQVHRQGCRYQPQELMREATGEPTSSRYHMEYLRRTFAG